MLEEYFVLCLLEEHLILGLLGQSFILGLFGFYIIKFLLSFIRWVSDVAIFIFEAIVAVLFLLCLASYYSCLVSYYFIKFLGYFLYYAKKLFSVLRRFLNDWLRVICIIFVYIIIMYSLIVWAFY